MPAHDQTTIRNSRRWCAGMLPHPGTGLSQDPDEYILRCLNCESFSHQERRWYDIDAYGGRLFDRWSWLMIVAGALGFFAPAGIFSPYLQIAIGLLLTSLLFLVAWTIRWARANR